MAHNKNVPSHWGAPTAPAIPAVVVAPLNIAAGAAIPDIPDADMGVADAQLANQAVHLLTQLTGGMLDALVTPLKDSGLKNSRKYRLMLLERFWQGKTRAQKLAFLTVIMFSSLVRTVDRMVTMARCIDDAALKAAVVVVLGSLVKYNADKTGAKATAFSGHNIAGAFPDLVFVMRALMFGVRDINYSLGVNAQALFGANSILAVAREGQAPANLVVAAADYNNRTLRAYLAHLGGCQYDFATEVLDPVKVWIVGMWSDTVMKKDKSGPAGFDDGWFNNTQGKDNYLPPPLWGVAAPAPGADLAALDAYVNGLVAAVAGSGIGSAGQWGNFTPM